MIKVVELSVEGEISLREQAALELMERVAEVAFFGQDQVALHIYFPLDAASLREELLENKTAMSFLNDLALQQQASHIHLHVSADVRVAGGDVLQA